MPEGAASAGSPRPPATAGTEDLEEDEDDEEDEVATDDARTADDAIRLGLGLAAGRAQLRARPRCRRSSDDEDDFDEPEIPEYLIAEQRRGQASRGGQGNRGGQAQSRWPRRRAAASYSAAIDRERYGRGGRRRHQPLPGRR